MLYEDSKSSTLKGPGGRRQCVSNHDMQWSIANILSCEAASFSLAMEVRSDVSVGGAVLCGKSLPIKR